MSFDPDAGKSYEFASKTGSKDVKLGANTLFLIGVFASLRWKVKIINERAET
jgi:hypothetical protein